MGKTLPKPAGAAHTVPAFYPMRAARAMPGPFCEDDLQKAVVSYLQGRRNAVRDLAYCHIPNSSIGLARAGKPDFRLNNHLKSMGLVAGAPDIIIWLPRGRTVSIELKGARGTQNEGQRMFAANLEALGHEYHVVRAETPGQAVNKVVEIISGAVS